MNLPALGRKKSHLFITGFLAIIFVIILVFGFIRITDSNGAGVQKLKEDFAALMIPSIQPAGDGDVYLVGIFDRFDTSQFDIKKLNGEKIGISKLSYWLWYLDEESDKLKRVRVVLVIQLTSGRNVVMANSYKTMNPGGDEIYQPERVQEYFKNRMVRGKVIGMVLFPNYKSANDFYNSPYVDKSSQENYTIVYKLAQDYAEGINGDFREMQDKRWKGNGGYVLPVGYVSNVYQSDGIILQIP